jgi:hypothetical protein
MGANARRRHGPVVREEKVPTPLFPRSVWKKGLGGIPEMGVSMRDVKRIERRETDGPVRSAHDRARSA